MGKYAKKKKTGRILTGMLLACCSLFVLGKSRAGTVYQPFTFTEYEYENWRNNVSEFRDKNTNSSMAAICISTSARFQIHALGSDDWGETSNYADCSGGYYYWLSAGDDINNIYNFVYENSYNCAGIQGDYGGDEYFEARGGFATDV